MSFSNHDQETIRRYLLGPLAEDEQARTEQRLLTEEDFFEEFEITKDELVEEYLEKRLSQAEHQWFEQNFLASPEGKQTHALSRSLNRYVLNHPPAPQKRLTWVDRIAAFWNSQPILARAAGAIAVMLFVAGVFWFSLVPSTKSFATLTLQNTSSTRSAGTESARVNLKEDALRLILMLPTPSTPGIRYRIELKNDKGETKTYEAAGQNDQSVSVEIPATQLLRGQYAITLSAISANGTAQRIPGSYYFTVE